MNAREKLIAVFEGNKDKVIDYLLIENSRLESKVTAYSIDKIDRLNSIIEDYKHKLEDSKKELEMQQKDDFRHWANQSRAVWYLEKKVKRQKEALTRLQTVIERDKDTQEELYEWAKEHGYFEEEEDE